MTNNKLTDEKIKIRINEIEDRRSASRDFWYGDYEYPEDIELLALRELQERRKADNQEPAGYHVIKECGKVGCSVATPEEAEKTRDFWNKKWTIRPYFYAAPPVQETGVYKDMLNIISLLKNNEWAEHCTSTVLGSLLESEITRLVGKEHPVPVVPDEITSASAPEIFEIAAEAERLGLRGSYASYAVGWNACRAAMLQGGTKG
ncbi:hypothetical protein [Citrobacter freundii]|uniref:hypothetical protein n=1 Tax=Citrobacter freundii TaxID=546 RepID=UPI0039908B03